MRTFTAIHMPHDLLELMDYWWYLNNNSIQAILCIQQCRYRISESWSKIHEVLDGSSSILKDINMQHAINKGHTLLKSVIDIYCRKDSAFLQQQAGSSWPPGNCLIVSCYQFPCLLEDLFPCTSSYMYIFAMYTIMKHFFSGTAFLHHANEGRFQFPILESSTRDLPNMPTYYHH